MTEEARILYHSDAELIFKSSSASLLFFFFVFLLKTFWPGYSSLLQTRAERDFNFPRKVLDPLLDHSGTGERLAQGT